MSGFYLMRRGWADNPVFAREPFCEQMAWLWLIEAAAWQPRQARLGGNVIDLARGQLVGTVRDLAERWHWSKSRVDRFLARLAGAGMIQKRSSSGTTLSASAEVLSGRHQNLISICNYSKYQVAHSSSGTPAPEQQRDSRDALAGTQEKKEGIKIPTPERNPSLREGQRKRGSRLPADFVVPQAWLDDATTARVNAGLPAADLGTEGVKFANYFAAATGANAVKSDWRRTFVNWALNAKGGPSNGRGQPSSPTTNLYAGAAIALARRAQRAADRGTDLDPDEPLLDLERPAGNPRAPARRLD